MTKSKLRIPDLMMFAGAMVILCAIPEGIVFAFQSRQAVQADGHWEIISGGVMTLAMVVTGGLLILIGGRIVKRRQKEKDKLIPK
jgi:hypothetical protein